MNKCAVSVPAKWNADDPETQTSLDSLAPKDALRGQIVPAVRTVLVVFSATAMAFDAEALRQKIGMTYPDAAVFFQSTAGKPFGVPAPHRVDLLIDLTAPDDVGSFWLWGKQGSLQALRLWRRSRFQVGRKSGILRTMLYGRVYDESRKDRKIAGHPFDHERQVQVEVLKQAGIPMTPTGDLTADRATSIALELPPLSQ